MAGGEKSRDGCKQGCEIGIDKMSKSACAGEPGSMDAGAVVMMNNQRWAMVFYWVLIGLAGFLLLYGLFFAPDEDLASLPLYRAGWVSLASILTVAFVQLRKKGVLIGCAILLSALSFLFAYVMLPGW